MTTQHAVTLPFVTKTKQNHITWALDCKITQTHVHTHIDMKQCFYVRVKWESDKY